jgi:hypothetical protein
LKLFTQLSDVQVVDWPLIEKINTMDLSSPQVTTAEVDAIV